MMEVRFLYCIRLRKKMNGIVSEKILSKIYDVLVRIEKHLLKRDPKKETPIGRIKWWKDESTKLDDF